MKFLPNIIRRDISRPELFNLVFNILPRVINVINNIEKVYFIPFIKNVIKEYIKAENYINLLTLIITHDAINSSTFNLIKEIKVEIRIVEYLIKFNRINLGEVLNQ